jgi:Ecdysteroid kinase-like family
MGNHLALPTTVAELTPTYLTEVLRHSGHLAAGEVIGVESNIVGTGVGFVGQLARLELTYSGDPGDLPPTMVAKFPNDFPMARDIAQAYGFYRTEAECYRQARHGELGVPTPDIYVAEVSDDDRGTLILMQDLSDGRMADQVEGASLADAQAVIDVGAQLHATWWQSPKLDQLEWLRPLNNPAYKAGQQQFQASLPVFADLFGHLLPAGTLDVAERVGGQLARSYDWTVDNRPLTLAHVDFRLDNFFFDRPNAPVTVIDWQLSVRSLGVGDISYFITQSMSTEMRREHGMSLLHRWHDALVERGVSGYSYEDAYADFRRAALFQLTIPVVGASNLDPANERGLALLECLVSRAFQALADYDCAEMLLD